jgi:hypothetical protein
MKSALMFGLLICIGMSALTSTAHASEKKCKVATNDVGTIIGRGPSSEEAFEDAATQCFDRHEKLYKMKKSSDHVDEDSGLVMIDVCANIRCS